MRPFRQNKKQPDCQYRRHYTHKAETITGSDIKTIEQVEDSAGNEDAAKIGEAGGGNNSSFDV